MIYHFFLILKVPTHSVAYYINVKCFVCYVKYEGLQIC